ncbi:hypothetical protein [Metallumcola ferriviriculae]
MSDENKKDCQVKSVTEVEEPDYSQCEDCVEEQCPLMDGLC